MVAAAQPQIMSPEEIRALCHEWQQHFDLLEGKVDPGYLAQARGCLTPDYIDGEPFHLSPVLEYIPYELYGLLTCAPPGQDPDALLICRLTAGEVQQVWDENDPARINEDFGDDPLGRFLNIQLGLAELTGDYEPFMTTLSESLGHTDLED